MGFLKSTGIINTYAPKNLPSFVPEPHLCTDGMVAQGLWKDQFGGLPLNKTVFANQR
jgi:hypothetical protein